MKQEIIKTEAGMTWIKHCLSPGERLRRFGRLLPDLFLPDFWDGEKTVYDTLSGRWETFMDDLKEGILGYWVGGQPVCSSCTWYEEKGYRCLSSPSADCWEEANQSSALNSEGEQR